MTTKPSAALFKHIDQLIETSEPQRADYFRGFRQGIQVYLFGPSEESNKEISDMLKALDSGLGGPYLEAFARGYQDGCRGMIPQVID